MGRGEGHQQELDKVLQQLADLNCFDGDSSFLNDFRETLFDEIKNGAEKVGIIGSRAKGTQISNKSDLDVVTINPRVSKNSPSKDLQVVENKKNKLLGKQNTRNEPFTESSY